MYKSIRDAIDTQNSYTRAFHGFVGNTYLTHHGDSEKPIFSALAKNELSLYACLSLTRDGFYGVALNQLRLVYEALMIAKVAALLKYDKLINKWISGDTIYFSNGVMKRIKSPAIPNLKELWPILSEQSHATIHSAQVVTRFSEIRGEISGTLAVIGMLACCNFHLLNRHFVTPQMVGIGKRYFADGKFIELRASSKMAAGAVSKHLSPLGRTVVREYGSTWNVA